MILSNVGIIGALDAGDIEIDGMLERDPTRPPYNTSSLDLRLAPDISVPKEGDPVLYRLDQPYALNMLIETVTRSLSHQNSHLCSSGINSYSHKR